MPMGFTQLFHNEFQLVHRLSMGQIRYPLFASADTGFIHT